MQWPFKTTVRFAGRDGNVVRLQYAVSAMSESEAKQELERRLPRAGSIRLHSRGY